MTALPEVIPRNASNTLLSFNFTDYIGRTGYVTYYGIATNGSLRSLSPARIDSNDYATTTVPGLALNMDLDYDFDILFNNPATVKGDAFVSVTYSGNNGGSANAVTCYTKIKIVHVNTAGTETIIGAQQTTDSLVVATGTGTSYGKRATCKFTISKKHFSIGEKLRVSVEFWTIRGAGAGHTATLYHDGSNRDGPADQTTALGTDSTDLVVNVPFLAQ